MKTVICIGDSITEGIGASCAEKFSYCADLQDLLGCNYRVINCGRNGATLMDPPNGNPDRFRTLPHFERAREAARLCQNERCPLIVSIMLGTNDADIIDYGFEGRGEAYYSRYSDAFKKEMLSLVEELRLICPDARFIICKSPYSYDTQKHTDYGNLEMVWRLQEQTAAILKEKNIPIYLNDIAAATSPERIGGEAGVEKLFLDRLHPNDVGHMYLAHFFCEAVHKLEE